MVFSYHISFNLQAPFPLTRAGKRNNVDELSAQKGVCLVDSRQRLRRLPSVDAVLAQEDVQEMQQNLPRRMVVEGIRRVLEARRQAILNGQGSTPDQDEQITATEISESLARWNAPPLVSVINATGVVVHTNLGRAPLSKLAAEKVAEIAASYSNLELNLATGKRGSRMDLIRQILLESTGAEDVLVVNNNAAAVYLALRVMGFGRQVLVSRGELVEIGGSFRIPDVMAASGAKLVEVGTTNKTRLDDYRRALGPDTALVLKVHRSNFAMVGFTEDTSVAELAELTRQHRIPLVMDMGWGTVLEDLPGGLVADNSLADILGQGADVVCFSGDKLLGGPQAGILLGKQNWIQQMAKDPMARALRVDKLTLAALWATLIAYRGGLEGGRSVPVLDMLLARPEDLSIRASSLLAALAEKVPAVAGELVSTSGQAGGGAMPDVNLPGFGVALNYPACSAGELAERLRQGSTPVMARVHRDRVVLDVRTIRDQEEMARLVEAVSMAAAMSE